MSSSFTSTSSLSSHNNGHSLFLYRLSSLIYRFRFVILALLFIVWGSLFFSSFSASNSGTSWNTRGNPSSQRLKSAVDQLEQLAESQREIEAELNEIKSLLHNAAFRVNHGDGGTLNPDLQSFLRNLSKPSHGRSKTVSKAVAAAAAMIANSNKSDNCSFVVMDPRFPHCADKVKWMSSFWKSDSCYASFGVDGSLCSFYIFLSEVERFCPRLPWRPKDIQEESGTVPNHYQVSQQIAGVDEILSKLNEDRVKFIAHRINGSWPMWQDAWQELFGSNSTKTQQVRRRKTVIVHLGFLTPEIERRWHMAETASKGGPLGEMVQWSDVIASIHALGHEIVITYDKTALQNVLAQRTKLSATSCQANTVTVDLVYTDIVGYKQAASVLHQSGIKCRVRIVDSFGTEPAYNHEAYSKKFKLSAQWGRLGMHPKQFYTLFPHSPDNSFMGFVVTIPKVSNVTIHRTNSSLVYGKHITMWQGPDIESYIQTISELTQIHGTVDENPVKQKQGEAPLSKLPPFVRNHGVVSPSKFHDLLWSSKIFVGLGFPYEGPAPLEAIAAGCVFLNPKFDPPHSSLNTKFFKGKPTTRGLTSQNPYAEKAIGKPRVITVDIRNPVAVREAVQEALKTEPQPYLPREFTAVGMLERLNAYIENQDLCSGEKPIWPPVNSVQFITSFISESCIAACERHDLICEPTHFYRLNSVEVANQLSKGKCSEDNTSFGEDVVLPVIGDSNCRLQKDMTLFSCAGADSANRRLCPCRDYVEGQLALCRNCL